MRVQFIQDLIDKARGKNFDKHQISVSVEDVNRDTIDLLFEKFDFAEFEINGKKRRYLTNVNADRGVTEQALSLLCDSFPGDRSRIKVLNVGCGKKSQNDFLSTLGFDVYGVDFDIEVDSERVRFHDLNTQNHIPFDSIDFDCVISQEIIEHIENPWLLFRKIKKVLKIGGIFIATTPNISSNDSKKVFLNNNLGFFAYFDPDNLWQHINPIPFWEMIHLSRFNGFDLMSLSGCNMYYVDYVLKNKRSRKELRNEAIIQNNNVLHYVFRNLNSDIKLYNPVPTHNYSWDKQ
jgi:2-polyprenyl-3-methyl-5-hydroxy-6-metoxy-1,4-benzoquinol methylase